MVYTYSWDCWSSLKMGLQVYKASFNKAGRGTKKTPVQSGIMKQRDYRFWMFLAVFHMSDFMVKRPSRMPKAQSLGNRTWISLLVGGFKACLFYFCYYPEAVNPFQTGELCSSFLVGGVMSNQNQCKPKSGQRISRSLYTTDFTFWTCSIYQYVTSSYKEFHGTSLTAKTVSHYIEATSHYPHRRDE
jgi:hypothetical protein